MNTTLNICPEHGVPFQDMLFGLNLEITRRGIFGGLSAEMLCNRKLYAGDDLPSGWACSGAVYITDQPQKSLCASRFVVLHNGDMSQTSEVISLRHGNTYEARLWVKAMSSSAKVTFGVNHLVKTCSVDCDEAMYTVLSFRFAGEDIDNGTFTVSVCGEVAVFELSLLPTDHFYGMRRDVIEQLARIAPTSLRFPGGCAADHFDWKESLKSPEFRVPSDGSSKWFLYRDSYNQDCMDIGLHEFFMLCREIHAEPEFTVSLLLSDGEDAAHLVEYCNGGEDTVYGAMRQERGFDPFDVKLWYIGNEAYFFGGPYQASGAAAAERTNELVRAMKAVDPTISVVLGLTWGVDFQAWSREFMAVIDCPYEYVSFHDYIGILPDPTQGHNGMATCALLEDNFRDGQSMGLNFYRNDLFAGKFDPIRICADEWNYSWGYDSSNAMVFSNALQFHFFAKSYETYHIVRAEFFMPVNEGMISVRGAECRAESTAELFVLMAGHKGGVVIPCTAENPDLDILCTAHEDGTYYLSVVNRRSEPITLDAGDREVLSCTALRTEEYSFDCNEYAVVRDAPLTVSGHSVLFLTLRTI